MFSLCDNVLAHSKTLRKVLRAAHHQDDPENNCGNASLPEICEELEMWVSSENMNPRKRMSLRTSAVLVDGAVKVYKQEMERLIHGNRLLLAQSTHLRDSRKVDRANVDQLDKDIIRRRRNITGDEEFIDSSESSLQSIGTPDLMMRQSQRPSDVSNISIIEKIGKTRQSSLNVPLSDHSMISCSEHSTSTREASSSKDTTSVRSNSRRDTTKSNGKSTSPVKDNQVSQETASRVVDKATLKRQRTDTTIQMTKSITKHGNSLATELSPSGHVSSKRLKQSDSFHATKSAEESRNTEPDLNKSDGRSDDSGGAGKASSRHSIILDSSTDRRNFGDTPYAKRSKRNNGKTVPGKRDQSTQTSFRRDSKGMGKKIVRFDKSLPFGTLFINDQYDSRIPSKIVFGSLCSNARNLACSGRRHN